MSATTVVACCCGVSERYYALKCPDLFVPCCNFNNCEGAPDRIDLCTPYMQAIGIPVPPDPTVCYVLAYDCCLYVLTGTDVGPCPNPASPWPTNVGTLVATFPKGNEPCCRPLGLGTQQLPPGTMGEVTIIGCGPLVQNPDPIEAPCTELIADCYDLCDQYGLVPGKHITVESTLSLCINLPGVPANVRCNHGPPDQTITVQFAASAKIGSCEPCEFLNGIPVPNPGGGYDCLPSPFSCPNQIVQVYKGYETCPNCWALVASDCCGGQNPCATDPNACAGVLDPYQSFVVVTCYSVNDCTLTGTQYHVEDLLSLTLNECLPLNDGFDPANPASLQTWVETQFLTWMPGVYPTCWGQMTTLDVYICGLEVRFISGTAKKLAEKINARIGAQVQATTLNKWADYFWFGNRQPCDNCPWQLYVTRAAYLPGDEFEIGPITYDAATGTITVILRGKSPKKYCCVAQSLEANHSETYAPNCLQDQAGTGQLATTVCKITATDLPYLIDCLSMPEYASGERYNWLEVEQEATTQDICVDPGNIVTVTKCPARAGWPLENIVVTPPVDPPYISVYGWHTLCASMPDPAYECRCHPLIYNPAPCCPDDYPDCEVWEATHPLPVPCVTAFQNGGVYCETQATDLTVHDCGTV